MQNIQESIKARKLKSRIKNILSVIKFKGLNTSLARQLLIISSVVVFISLFLPWINDIKQNISFNSFSSINGNIGYFYFIFIIFIIFLVLDLRQKELFKKLVPINIKENLIYDYHAILSIIIIIIELSIINGINTYSPVVIGNGVIIFIIGNILRIIATILINKETKKDILDFISRATEKKDTQYEKYLEELSKYNISKDNMKLPF